MTNTRWGEVTKNEGLSAGASLLLCEIAELKDIKKLKRLPIRAVIFLEQSIKERAAWIIQSGLSA